MRRRWPGWPGWQTGAAVREQTSARANGQAKLTGVHVFGIANSNSLMRRDNDSLLDEMWPGVQRKRPLQPNESLISIEKAQRMLGYRPAHDWQG